jgi:YfiH family protein
MRPAVPFERDGLHLGIDLPGARALFTTRRGGGSPPPYDSLNLGALSGDRPETVRANRDRLAAELGLVLVGVHQVHGPRVVSVHEPPPEGAELVQADGVATDRSGIAPLVVVADCLPIAVAGGGAVAMLHAGWRGLEAGVVAAGVKAVRRLGGGGPLAAAIGPGAGPCCYEVGEEVGGRFASWGAGLRHGRNLDLKAIARRALESEGVLTVYDCGICTLCAEPGLFFSHRRDGGITGRQGGLAWLS